MLLGPGTPWGIPLRSAPQHSATIAQAARGASACAVERLDERRPAPIGLAMHLHLIHDVSHGDAGTGIGEGAGAAGAVVAEGPERGAEQAVVVGHATGHGAPAIRAGIGVPLSSFMPTALPCSRSER